MALHLLLYGEQDERLLLEYVAKRPVYISGFEISSHNQPVHRIGVEEVLELGYSDAFTFGLIHPDLGEITSVKSSTRKLSWKTEVVRHQDFLEQHRDDDIVDIFLSPLIIYRRPYFIDDVVAEAILIPTGGEAYPAINDWYKRIYSWCGRRSTNIFSWKRSVFPGQLVSETLNTRWAFPAAMRELGAGRVFCSNGLTADGLEIARAQQQRWPKP